jgi:outer membrane lipoprotein LolB
VNTRRFVIAGLALILAGCATAPPKPIGRPNRVAWHQRLERLKALSDWRLSGRIGVVNGENGGSGTLLWSEHAPRFSMTFSGPFGVGGFKLYGTPSGLFVDTGDKTFYTADPVHYLARRLGGPIPVKSLRYWALGMPAPGTPANVRVDEDGLLRRLVQDGWTIRYDRFQKASGLTLPARLKARRGQVRIKLVIDSWSVPAGKVIVN